MSVTSHRSAVTSAACFLAAVFAVSVSIGHQDPSRDGLAEDLIAPWCRIGSSQSWEGRPCVVPMQSAAAEGTGTEQDGQHGRS